MTIDRQTTEFICDVVKIDSVEKHPNADRLDVVRVGEYQIVAGRDEWKPGDVAVHVGPDAVVPLVRDEFAFLRTRLDVKGKAEYRIRAAKVRGVVSHGILIPVPQGISVYGGEGVEHLLDVYKWESPAERRLRRIEAVSLARNPGFVARFVRRIPFVAKLTSLVKASKKAAREVPDYSLVNLKKVPHLFEEGELVEVTEKIHGSNIRFGLWRGRPYVASHHVIKSDLRGWFWRKLWPFGRSKNHWYGNDIWSAWVHKHVDFKELPDNTIFYGEIYGKGVQDLEYGAEEHKVRVYDVWFVDKQRWATADERYFLCKQYGIEYVPMLCFYAPWGSDTFPRTDGDSLMANHLREGIVIRSHDGTRRGKLVSDEYKMRGV